MALQLVFWLWSRGNFQMVPLVLGSMCWPLPVGSESLWSFYWCHLTSAIESLCHGANPKIKRKKEWKRFLLRSAIKSSLPLPSLNHDQQCWKLYLLKWKYFQRVAQIENTIIKKKPKKKAGVLLTLRYAPGTVIQYICIYILYIMYIVCSALHLQTSSCWMMAHFFWGNFLFDSKLKALQTDAGSCCA